MKTKQLAYCAVMTALLIALQYVFSFVSGVELVTVIFLCFCYIFGARCGLLTAAAFSLLRCFLFGFIPNVIALYLIYYCLFAAVFGIAGKRGIPTFLCPVLLTALAAASAYFAIAGVPISILYQKRISVMLYVLLGISLVLLIFYLAVLIKNRNGKAIELASITALAAFCTVMFTLLDDVITPLFLGYSRDAAGAYFYTSFLAMLPQTICAAVSVFVLFYPIKSAFVRATRIDNPSSL